MIAVVFAFGMALIGGLAALEVWGSIAVIARLMIRLITSPLEKEHKAIRRDELRSLIPPCEGERRLTAACRAVAVAARLSSHDLVAGRIGHPPSRAVIRAVAGPPTRAIVQAIAGPPLTVIRSVAALVRTLESLFFRTLRGWVLMSVLMDIACGILAPPIVVISAAAAEVIVLGAYIVGYLLMDPDCGGGPDESTAGAGETDQSHTSTEGAGWR